MSDRERVSLLRGEDVSRKRYIPVIVVLLLVFLERLAFYSLTSNMFLFLNQTFFNWTPFNSMSILFVFSGVTFISCLLGGIIADTLLGRFFTILVGFLIFGTSYFFFPFLSRDNFRFNCSMNWMPIVTPTNDSVEIVHRSMFDEPCSGILISVIVSAAIGCGVVQSNIVPFGAEQGRVLGTNFLRVYSNFYYWCVNLGGLVAILAIAYIQQNGSFFIGYLVPAVCVAFSALVFLCCYPIFHTQPRTKEVFSKIFNILREAYKSNKRFKKLLARNQEEGQSLQNLPSWLDMAKVTYGGKFSDSAVEDLKSFRTILIVFFFLVPYWILYFQMQTTFLYQGLHMRLSFNRNVTHSNETSDDNVFHIPAAWLTLFNVIALLFCIPLMDRLVYPCLDRRGMRIPLLCRIGIGMCFACFSMLAAGTVEYFRFNMVFNNVTIYQTIEKTNFFAADMSILWQIPQYACIGCSEIFASIAGVEFACSQAPTSMKGAVMGLFYFFMGLGSFSASFTINFLNLPNGHSFDQEVLDDGRLYIYFFSLSIFQFVFIFLFFLVSRNLKIRRSISPEAGITSRVYLNGSHVSYDSIERFD